MSLKGDSSPPKGGEQKPREPGRGREGGTTDPIPDPVTRAKRADQERTPKAFVKVSKSDHQGANETIRINQGRSRTDSGSEPRKTKTHARPTINSPYSSRSFISRPGNKRILSGFYEQENPTIYRTDVQQATPRLSFRLGNAKRVQLTPGTNGKAQKRRPKPQYGIWQRLSGSKLTISTQGSKRTILVSPGSTIQTGTVYPIIPGHKSTTGPIRQPTDTTISHANGFSR